MSITIDHYLAQLIAATGVTYTEEQKEVIRNFNKSGIILADPGTGKTQTVIAGVLAARQVYGIPANKIRAMSFTIAATNEMKSRFDSTCRALRIRPNIEFSTYHSFAYTICTKYFSIIGMKESPSIDSINHKSLVRNLEDIAKDFDITLNSRQFRNLATTMSSLNSSLIFDEYRIKETKAFKDLDLPYETFLFFRERVFLNNIRSCKVPRGEICLYALAILLSDEKLSEQIKNDMEIIVVDESQDMSILLLLFLSKLCKNLIIMGDIKQQIYYWNGACPQIFKEYKKLYPDAATYNLTKSFRFGNDIAEFSKKIVEKNRDGGGNMRGLDKSDTINISQKFDVDNYLKSYRKDMDKMNGIAPREVMFLYRNNLSSIYLSELLYRYRIPAQIPKYISVIEIPVVSDLVDLIDLAIRPDVIENGNILSKVLREFDGYKGTLNPLQSLSKKLKVSMLEVNYAFKYPEVADLLSSLLEVKEMYDEGANVRDLFNFIYRPYYYLHMDYYMRYLEKDPEYYLKFAFGIGGTKKFDDFKLIEKDKTKFFKEYTNKVEGIRCFTVYSGKGTEADEVTLLDMEEGLFPDDKRMLNLINSDCEQEAYNLLRNERCLVFVACTRARNVLNINYNVQEASILYGSTKFDDLENNYSEETNYNQDIDEFNALINRVVNKRK